MAPPQPRPPYLPAEFTRIITALTNHIPLLDQAQRDTLRLDEAIVQQWQSRLDSLYGLQVSHENFVTSLKDAYSHLEALIKGMWRHCLNSQQQRFAHCRMYNTTLHNNGWHHQQLIDDMGSYRSPFAQLMTGNVRSAMQELVAIRNHHRRIELMKDLVAANARLRRVGMANLWRIVLDFVRRVHSQLPRYVVPVQPQPQPPAPPPPANNDPPPPYPDDDESLPPPPPDDSSAPLPPPPPSTAASQHQMIPGVTGTWSGAPLPHPPGWRPPPGS